MQVTTTPIAKQKTATCEALPLWPVITECSECKDYNPFGYVVRTNDMPKKAKYMVTYGTIKADGSYSMGENKDPLAPYFVHTLSLTSPSLPIIECVDRCEVDRTLAELGIFTTYEVRDKNGDLVEDYIPF